jgi:hypothetical protein
LEVHPTILLVQGYSRRPFPIFLEVSSRRRQGTADTPLRSRRRVLTRAVGSGDRPEKRERRLTLYPLPLILGPCPGRGFPGSGEKYPAEVSGRSTRQKYPAEVSGRSTRQKYPAEVPGRSTRQKYPAEVPGRSTRQKYPAKQGDDRKTYGATGNSFQSSIRRASPHERCPGALR